MDNFSSIMIIVAVLVAMISITCPGVVQAQEAKRLAVAQGSGWQSEIFEKEVCQIYPCIEGGYTRRGAPDGFYTVEAKGPDSFSFLKFGDASFFVPPLGNLVDGQAFGPVVSDQDFILTVTVFAGAPTTISIETVSSSQRCDVTPPVTQCVVDSFIYVGSITLRKSPGVGCPGCNHDALPGFVAFGSRNVGSTYKVYPFGE